MEKGMDIFLVEDPMEKNWKLGQTAGIFLGRASTHGP